MNTEKKIKVRLELPRNVYESESMAANENYALGEPESLPPDPEAMEARFIDPVSLLVTLTVAVLSERILHFTLAKRGHGVLVDARVKPPNVSTMKGVPQGFVVIIHPDGATETVRADAPGNNLSNLLGTVLK